VSFVSGTNQVLATDLTATNGDMITGGIGSDTLTIDTGAGTNHIFVFGDGGNGHSDIGLVKFENLTLTDKNASANDQDSITVTFDSNFQNGGTLTVDGSALHELNGTNLTIDARLATHDSFVLVGSNAADTLTGGSHGDIIVGNGGGDTLTGGGGGDSFVFKTLTVSQPGGSHFDTITDFTHNSDHIDLTAIAGATVVQGNVVTANTVDAHSISWFVDTAHNQTVVYVNTTDAANTVSMEVHLAGANVNLAGSDILHHT
jgi:Ca2+-binding RTX toxin-like protein